MSGREVPPRGIVKIGTSGWSYPSGAGTWNGLFYPPRRPGLFKAGDELAYYAEHFETVEVNSTFYRPPEADLSRRWVRQTPADFEFSIKLHQAFTHPTMHGRGTGLPSPNPDPAAAVPHPPSTDLDAFRAGLDPIAAAGRLGMLLAQFPPGFHDTPESRDYLASLLTSLLDYSVAVELRHRSWSDHGAETLALLDQFGATWVQIDEPKFASSIRQGPDRGEGRVNYLRLHGRNAAQWWVHESPDDRYNYLYSENELGEFAEALARIRERARKAYVYLNNHFAAKAVVNATVLRQKLGLPVRGEYRAELVDRYPELRGIVSPPTDLLS